MHVALRWTPSVGGPCAESGFVVVGTGGCAERVLYKVCIDICAHTFHFVTSWGRRGLPLQLLFDVSIVLGCTVTPLI